MGVWTGRKGGVQAPLPGAQPFRAWMRVAVARMRRKPQMASLPFGLLASTPSWRPCDRAPIAQKPAPAALPAVCSLPLVQTNPDF